MVIEMAARSSILKLLIVWLFVFAQVVPLYAASSCVSPSVAVDSIGLNPGHCPLCAALPPDRQQTGCGCGCGELAPNDSIPESPHQNEATASSSTTLQLDEPIELQSFLVEQDEPSVVATGIELSSFPTPQNQLLSVIEHWLI